MIDLHSHILPGVDDGASDMEMSLSMARAAVADGVSTMVATPHVNETYDVQPDEIGEQVGHLNLAIARAGIALAVLPGAEVGHTRAAALQEAELRMACLGSSAVLLIESPYSSVTFFEEQLFDLHIRGYRTLLAHPERCKMFQADHARLAALVDRGVLCCVNVASLVGGFGRAARTSAVAMLRDGLVHTLASDCHDDVRRPPGLSGALESVAREVPGIEAQADWLTVEAPSALLSGDPLPARPPLPEQPPSRWQRLRRRRGAIRD